MLSVTDAPTWVMVSVRGLTTVFHILHSCSLFSEEAALWPMAPSTASAKAKGDVGPDNPQLTSV